MKRLLPLIILCLCAKISGAEELKPMNVKYMLYGYCFAGSRPDKDAPGGYGSSGNMPQRIPGELGAPGTVSLVAVPSDVVPYGKGARGFSLYLINRSKGDVSFSAMDSRLPIICEAMDAKGKWRPIEELLSSWCGNSYHRVFLPRNRCWQFAAPEYTGSRKTRMRFVMQEEPPVYSNEFEGSINPAQFTKKRDYEASNLMDPYGK